MADTPSALGFLRDQARRLRDRAHVPFSGEPAAAAALLRDGRWVPGVRLESAAFSLTIPAVLNLITTLVAIEEMDAVVALTASRPLTAADRQYLGGLADPPRHDVDADTVVWTPPGTSRSLPSPTEEAAPFLDATVTSPSAGIQLARTTSERAYIPASNFPVGAVVETSDGPLLPGVNVEHTDWTRTLCAERNALGTAYSFGITDFAALYLSCPLDPHGTPCGACRQLLSELAPDIRLWMDRDTSAPEVRTPADLLPGSFRGAALLEKDA